MPSEGLRPSGPNATRKGPGVHANIDAFYRPRSLAEAILLLSDPARKAIPVAGATEVGLRVRSSVRTLVDLSGLGLDHVRSEQDGLHLGAMVRATRIHRDTAIRATIGDALPEAAFAIASEPIRNLTSIGGNVIHLTSWSDMPPALQVLWASFRVQGSRDRTYSAVEFFAQAPKKLVQRGDLLTEVIIPRPLGGSGSAFLKHAKTAVDFALVNAAALVVLDAGRAVDVRLSVGAIHTPPIRLPSAEAALRGGPVTPERLADVEAAVASEVSPVKDPRASEKYLRHAAGVLVRRAATLAAERAAHGDSRWHGDP